MKVTIGDALLDSLDVKDDEREATGVADDEGELDAFSVAVPLNVDDSVAPAVRDSEENRDNDALLLIETDAVAELDLSALIEKIEVTVLDDVSSALTAADRDCRGVRELDGDGDIEFDPDAVIDVERDERGLRDVIGDAEASAVRVGLRDGRAVADIFADPE